MSIQQDIVGENVYLKHQNATFYSRADQENKSCIMVSLSGDTVPPNLSS